MDKTVLIDQLPDFLLTRIFSFIPTKDLYHILCVTRKWNMVAKHPTLWRNVDFDVYNKEKLAAYTSFIRNHPEIRSIQCYNPDKLFIERVVTRCAHLTELCLIQVSGNIRPEDIHQLAKACPNISRFRMSTENSISKDLITFSLILQWNKLTHLSLSGFECIISPDYDMSSITKTVLTLKDLDLNFSLPEYVITPLIRTHSQHLEKLHIAIKDSNDFQKILTSLDTCCKLRNLSITSTNSLFFCVGGGSLLCNTLVSLTLSSLDKSASLCLATKCVFANVKEVAIKFHQVSSTFAEDVALIFPNLRFLKAMNAGDIIHVIKHCKKLHHVDILLKVFPRACLDFLSSGLNLEERESVVVNTIDHQDEEIVIEKIQIKQHQCFSSRDGLLLFPVIISTSNDTSINDLPDEILVQIFSHFNARFLSRCCSVVCRRWWTVTSFRCLWKSVNFGYYKEDKLEAYVNLVKLHPEIRSLECEFAEADFFVKVIASCSRLTRVKVPNSKLTSVEPLKKMLLACPNIVHLDMSEDELDVKCEDWKNFLDSFNVENFETLLLPYNMKSRAIISNLFSAKKLKKLEINPDSDDWIDLRLQFIRVLKDTLEEISIHSMGIELETYGYLNECERLTKLRLDISFGIEYVIHTRHKTLPHQLKTLHISTLDFDEDDIGPFVSVFPSVKELSVDGSGKEYESKIITKSFPNLEKLVLYALDDINVDAVSHIFDHCKELVEFVIPFFRKYFLLLSELHNGRRKSIKMICSTDTELISDNILHPRRVKKITEWFHIGNNDHDYKIPSLAYDVL